MQTHPTIPQATDHSELYRLMGAWLCGFIVLGVLALIFTQSILITLIIAALGATCTSVLIFPEAPYCNASVLTGQLFSTLLSWIFIEHFGVYWTAPTILLGTALSCTMLFNAYRTHQNTHPIQAKIKQHVSWGFLFFPNIFSTIAVIFYATYLNTTLKNGNSR